MSKTFRASVALVTPLLLVVACTHDRNVRGPDGEVAHAISCSDPDSCYTRAAELCPDGYVIRTTAGAVYVGGGVGGPRSRTSLLVSCKSDLPKEPEAPTSEIDTECAAAYRQAADFADYYARVMPGGTRLDALPSRRAFVSVCRKLPETVQLCMHDKYREDHSKACDAVVTRLDASDRNRIEGLFFEATGIGDARAP